MSQKASFQFTKSCVPAEGFIQILTVAAACALADVTLTATQRVVWLRRLQLFPLHYDLLNSLQALSPTKSAYSKGKNFTLGTSHQKKLPHQNTQIHLKSQIFLFIFCIIFKKQQLGFHFNKTLQKMPLLVYTFSQSF